jgi:hypothetical protein
MVVATMIQFMLWSNDAVAKALIIVALFVKFIGGIPFWLLDKRRYINIYFYSRIIFDLIVIAPLIIGLVSTNDMTIINAIVAILIIA